MAKITQEMIEQIRLEAAKLGRTPMRDESEIKGPIQGGWHNAVEEAGLCPYDGFRKDKNHPFPWLLYGNSGEIKFFYSNNMRMMEGK